MLLTLLIFDICIPDMTVSALEVISDLILSIALQGGSFILASIYRLGNGMRGLLCPMLPLWSAVELGFDTRVA